MMVGAHRGQGGSDPPGGGVTGGCELPDMVAGSLTLSPGREVHSLSCRALSPAPRVAALKARGHLE